MCLHSNIPHNSGITARGASASEQVKCQAVVDALNNQLPDDVTLDHISGADIAKVSVLK